MKNNKFNIAIAVGLILMVGIARIVNHEMHLYNFAPIGALGLFCGAVIKDKRIAFSLAIFAQLLGDIYISLFTQWQGFYGIEQVFVYAALLLVALLGSQMGQPRSWKVLGYTLAGSTIFFIVSNFGVWLSIEFGKVDLFHYGRGFQGLVNTYVNAIPFFKNTLAGDLAGSVLLFGAYYLLQLGFSRKLQKASV